QELEHVLDAAGVAADQVGHHVVLQVGGHGQLAAVEGGVAQPVHARGGGDLQGDEVAPRAGDDDLRVHDAAIAGGALRGGLGLGGDVHRAGESCSGEGTESWNGPAGRPLPS